MENTVSLEVAKKLHEAGYRPDQDSYAMYIVTDEGEVYQRWKHWKGSTMRSDYQYYYSPQMHEIWSLIPTITQYKGKEYGVCIARNEEGETTALYIRNGGIACMESLCWSQNPHDAVALLWIWLKENNYLPIE